MQYKLYIPPALEYEAQLLQVYHTTGTESICSYKDNGCSYITFNWILKVKFIASTSVSFCNSQGQGDLCGIT